MSVQTFQWQSQLALAKNALISGDYLTADSCLTAAINFGHSENAPEEAVADIFYHRGICYESRKRYDEAKRSFNQSYHTFARCLGPTSMQAVRAAKAKCLVEIKMGRPEDAKLHFERIAELLTRELGENDPEVIAVKGQIKDLFSQAEPKSLPGTEVEIEPYVEVDSWRPARRTVEMDMPRLPPEAALALAKKGAVQAAVAGAIASHIQDAIPAQDASGQVEAPTARESASAALAAAAYAAATQAAAASGPTHVGLAPPGASPTAKTVQPPGQVGHMSQKETSKISQPALIGANSFLMPPHTTPAMPPPMGSLKTPQIASPEPTAPPPEVTHQSAPEATAPTREANIESSQAVNKINISPVTAKNKESDEEVKSDPNDDWGPIPTGESLTEGWDENINAPDFTPDTDVKVRIVQSHPEAFAPNREQHGSGGSSEHFPQTAGANQTGSAAPPQLSIVAKHFPPESNRRTEPSVRPSNQQERRASETSKTDAKPVAKIEAKAKAEAEAICEARAAAGKAVLSSPSTESAATSVADTIKDAPILRAPHLESPTSTKTPPAATPSIATNKPTDVNKYYSEELKHKVGLARTMMDTPKYVPSGESFRPDKAQSAKVAEPKVESKEGSETDSKEQKQATVGDSLSVPAEKPTKEQATPERLIDAKDDRAIQKDLEAAHDLPAPVELTEPDEPIQPKEEKHRRRPDFSRKMLSGPPTEDMSKVTEFEAPLTEPTSSDEPSLIVVERTDAREKRHGSSKVPKPTPPKPLIAHPQFIRPLEIDAFIHPREQLYTNISKVVAVIGYGICVISGVGIIIASLVALIQWIIGGIHIGQIKGRGIKVSSTQFPEVYESLHHMSAALGLPTAPETYVVHEHGMLNAMAQRLHHRDIVVVYADVVELAYSFGEAELAFVIAHELSHIRCGHVQFGWLEFPAKLVPFLGKALSRAREYTCDRIAQELVPDGALMGLVALAAGTKLYRRVNLKAMYEQQEAESNFWTWFSEILSTHPNLINRITELGLSKKRPEDSNSNPSIG